MTLQHAIWNARRRADAADRRYVVWPILKRANGYAVAPLGEIPENRDAGRDRVYVAVPGTKPPENVTAADGTVHQINPRRVP